MIKREKKKLLRVDFKLTLLTNQEVKESRRTLTKLSCLISINQSIKKANWLCKRCFPAANYFFPWPWRSLRNESIVDLGIGSTRGNCRTKQTVWFETIFCAQRYLRSGKLTTIELRSETLSLNSRNQRRKFVVTSRLYSMSPKPLLYITSTITSTKKCSVESANPSF